MSSFSSTSRTAFEEAVEVLKGIEHVGEDIINSQEQIVDFDRKRNKNREALRMLDKRKDNKVWLCFSNMFIKVENAKAIDIIERDQRQLNENIDLLRDDLKGKLSQMRKIEGKPIEEGFDLQPLSKKESQALKNVLPTVV